MREYNFDGLVGPTHNYGGLSVGNIASMKHEGLVSNPRAAFLQGLAKMRALFDLGLGQAVLPPHERPRLSVLRRIGFTGSDEEVLAKASEAGEHWPRLVGSASAMWTANAATVAPSSDTQDGRLHITPANLQELFHRSIEADVTHRILAAIFADEARFAVHEPLPPCRQFADEGAANHTRLFVTGKPAVHVFAWGRLAFEKDDGPRRFPARQTREASDALARLHRLDPSACLFPRQHPEGIDAGAFHTDVLAVGNGSFFMLHELAFADRESLERELRERLGDEVRIELATNAELPVADAVAAYPFNSQVLTLGDGSMTILAPEESRENERARRFLERVVEGRNPVTSVRYMDLRQSMQNGGGPACLRQRIPMTEEEVAAVRANVFFSPELERSLTDWAGRHYRDRLLPSDLRDPLFHRENMAALDELTRILGLGSVYDFQLA